MYLLSHCAPYQQASVNLYLNNAYYFTIYLLHREVSGLNCRVISSSDVEGLMLTCIARETWQGKTLFFLCPIKNADAYYTLKNFVV